MSAWDDDKPMLNIGVVAQFLEVHPETLRIWEKNNLINPVRRNRQRLYSSNDLKRLKFIHNLINVKGLNIAGVQQVIAMYPCWKTISCRAGQVKNKHKAVNTSKPCWKEENTYCVVIQDQADLCNNCEYVKNSTGCTD